MNPSGSVAFSIAKDHPALAGHFPGNPVVPGVLVLKCIADAACTTLGADLEVTGLPRVSFTAPLRPDQRFEVHITAAGEGSADFAVMRDSTRIAGGRLRYTRAGPQRR